MFNSKMIAEIDSQQKENYYPSQCNEERFLKWKKSEIFTEKFLRFLNENPIKSSVTLKEINLDSSAEIFKQFEEFEVMQKVFEVMKLVRIGSGPNGDPIVWDLNSDSILFLGHDELFEMEELNVSEVRSVKVADTIEDFFDKLLIGKMPVDSWEAAELQNTKN